MNTTVKQTVKYGGNTVGIGLGNALAYFGLQYAEIKYSFKFADPVVAMAFAGAIVSAVLLQVSRLTGGIKYVFDRVFPEKHDHPEE